jgi:hypothetical protein
MGQKKSDTMVCARATVKFIAVGSSFDRFCNRCNCHVAISPSGQARLGTQPHLEIICAQCFFETSESTERIELAAEPEIVLQEILGAEPNTWNERN